MAHRPIILGIVGDSAAGKTTLTKGIADILGEQDVTTICTDDYHKYDRVERSKNGITALHPDCNYVDIMEDHLAMLRGGKPILKPIYNHDGGTLDRPEYIMPKKYVIVEGLLGYSTLAARDCFDVKVYLAPPESLRTEWKVKRDTRKRGYSEEQVKAEMVKREPDSEQFIRPQRQWSDIIVSFYPPSDAGDKNDAQLNVRLILRPTIPHPDMTNILNSGTEGQHPVRLELQRDMSKPVDVLEIDGHATSQNVTDIEHILCSDVPDLFPFCSLNGNPDIGKLIGTTGETLQSYPLAITQLLIAYHVLKAAKVHQH
jgi:phosphoribulokinase